MERSFKTVPDDLRCRRVKTPSDGTFFVGYDLGPNSELDTASDGQYRALNSDTCRRSHFKIVFVRHPHHDGSYCCIFVSHTTLYHTFPDSLMVDLDDPAEPDMQGLHGMARTSHCNLECPSYRGASRATGRT